MNLLFKKILTNILVLMLVMLPLRSVVAMPLDMSSKHCQTATKEMAMMSHTGHHMISTDSVEKEPEQKKTACVCCSQCDGECAGCIHFSAITFEFFQLSTVTNAVPVSIVSEGTLTRNISPPSRPPLIL